MRTNIELAWAAGLFEGEGTFYKSTAGRNIPQLHARLAMTDEDTVRRFADVMGFGHMRGPADARPRCKPMWYWAVGSFEDFQATAAMLWPGLGSRRRARVTELLSLKRDA